MLSEEMAAILAAGHGECRSASGLGKQFSDFAAI
jgi:hypothetical protein